MTVMVMMMMVVNTVGYTDTHHSNQQPHAGHCPAVVQCGTFLKGGPRGKGNGALHINYTSTLLCLFLLYFTEIIALLVIEKKYFCNYKTIFTTDFVHTFQVEKFFSTSK